MRILVLGGTAFLSAEIARQALAAGHDVTCLARGTVSAPPDGATWLRADRSQGAAAYSAASDGAAPTAGGTPSSTCRGTPARRGRRSRRWRAPPGTGPSSPAAPSTRTIPWPGRHEDAGVLAPLAPGTELSAGNYGEAKAAIEHWTTELAGDKAHLCRAGLIGGPGDGSDRYGYWPARFARDADPVLVPDIPTDATQIIDVRDLAAWILTAAESGTTGALNAVGEPVPFAAYLEESRQLADGEAEVVVAPEDWLASHGANYWAGPDSLPLWLPPGHEGFATRSNAAARAAGLRTRPWMDTLRDTLADERRRGLGRERKAGMSPETERRILAEYKAAQ